MKTLIIYDSLFGNTKKIAEAVRDVAGKNHKVKCLHVADVGVGDLKGVKILIIGTPTHGGWYTDDIKKYLENVPQQALTGVKSIAFDTGVPYDALVGVKKWIAQKFGYASPRLAQKLKTLGADVIAAETFFVKGKEGPLQKGEIERARKWAKRLI